jgi:hypothetical protein
MKTIVTMCFFLILAACGNSSSNPSSQSQKNRYTEPLFNRSADEVLYLKYDKAFINCSVRLLDGGHASSSKKFQWNLLKDQNIIHRFDIFFAGKNATYSFQLSQVEIVDTLSHTSKVGHEFQMINTPIVSIFGSTTISMFRESRAYELPLVEKMNSQYINENTELRCSFHTKIKKSYREEFIRVR